MTPEELEAEIRASYNRTRGRLCGLIESWGLGEVRERAMISTLKTLTYDAENHLVELVNPED